MKVVVIGTGYVGLVVGACLAETGNDVVCADVDVEKIDGLRRNRLPIYEPGLEPIWSRNQSGGRLQFTSDVGDASVDRFRLIFIAVGTPQDEDGSADLQHVGRCGAHDRPPHDGPKIVITKSTVPAGTARARPGKRSPLHDQAPVSRMRQSGVSSERRAAIDDFMKHRPRWCRRRFPEAAQIIEELYAPFVRQGNPIIFMDTASAEMTKYAANAMLAMRVSFMNQFALLCEVVGADVTLVRKGIGVDRRIGPAFLFPGPGYGGSCFPKDVQALIRTGEERGVPLDILKAVEQANQRQKRVLFEELTRHFDGKLAGVIVPSGDSRSRRDRTCARVPPWSCGGWLRAGAKVRVHDPAALESARRSLGNRVVYAGQAYEAVEGAAALVIVTEWLEYRNPDFDRIKLLLTRPLIIDGRNLYDPERLARLGFVYDSIGRRLACASS